MALVATIPTHSLCWWGWENLKICELKWEVFKRELDHAIVDRCQLNMTVVQMRRFGGDNVLYEIFEILQVALTIPKMMNCIIYCFHPAWMGWGSYDNGVLPLDPWPH